MMMLQDLTGKEPVFMAQEPVWSDRRRIIFGLPWTFTKYTITKEKLLVESGVFNKNEEEIRLYRIMDLTLKRSFWQRLFGLGTVYCCTADKSTPEVNIANIKQSSRVKDLLSDLVETERMAKRVASREFFSDDDGDADGDGDADHDL